MVDNMALQEFLTHPQTIVRILYIFCTLVLFSVLTHDGEYTYKPNGNSTIKFSVYNCDDPPLDFTIGIGIFGFLIGVFFLCAHLLNEISSSMVKYHSQLLKLDLVFSIFFCGLFFIAFCWTTNAWTGKDGCCVEVNSACTFTFKDLKSVLSSSEKNGAQTGIAFSFICTLLAGAIAYFSYSNIRSPLEDQQADVCVIGMGLSVAYRGAADPGDAFPYSQMDSDVPYANMDENDQAFLEPPNVAGGFVYGEGDVY